MASQLAEQSRTHKIEATIIAKALPQVGEKHGETVCVAALDDNRNWYRLYPVTFRSLGTDQRFGRWNKVRATCRLVAQNKDRRAESRSVDQSTIQLLGKLSPDKRTAFIERALVASTKKEHAEGRSLALIRPEQPEFFWKERSREAIAERLAAYHRLAAQPDLLGSKPLTPLTAAPYEFYYRYRDADGLHTCRCHDWEVEQTFINWQRKYGSEETLRLMMNTYGVDYPANGMVFSMGTHSAYPDKWMIIGVVRMNPTPQLSFL